MIAKAVFFGTPEFAAPFLNSLILNSSFEVALVVTSPDKPVGRKQILTPPVVKQISLENQIPVLQSEDPEDWEKEIKKILPDFLVVVAFGKIIPKGVLDLAKGAVNVHPSLLPKLRGASPIQSAILKGLDKTGITIMLMDEKMDHGPILKQEEVILKGKETSESLHNGLALRGVPLLKQVLKDFSSITPMEQD
ncbi:MAG: methionyl-tRNA formyltransferase, partial [Patescibacteria group bacterium]